jgi:hypothetical protein
LTVHFFIGEKWEREGAEILFDLKKNIKRKLSNLRKKGKEKKKNDSAFTQKILPASFA